MNRTVLLLILAVVAFVLAAVSAQSGDEIIVAAGCWIGIGLALFAGSHLPG